MRAIVGLLIILLLCSHGQTHNNREQGGRLTFFNEPRESVLPVIAEQPDCPLKFERAMYLHSTEGGGRESWRVRNEGEKPIILFTIATVSMHGGGGSLLERRSRNRSEWIMPGQLWPRNDSTEIVPLTDELRSGHLNGERMKTLLVFLVVRLEFADGSTYSDEKMYQTLKIFCENVTIDQHRQ